MEVLGSDVGQAADQQQNETSHRCQRLSPNKQYVFGALSRGDTQTQRCQPQGTSPPLSFPDFMCSKVTFEIKVRDSLGLMGIY